jgi:hypothetical protein
MAFGAFADLDALVETRSHWRPHGAPCRRYWIARPILKNVVKNASHPKSTIVFAMQHGIARRDAS